MRGLMEVTLAAPLAAQDQVIITSVRRWPHQPDESRSQAPIVS